MDPYLEKPALWPDVHLELISGIRAQLDLAIDYDREPVPPLEGRWSIGLMRYSR
jgi:hypothetical protein